MCSNTHGIRHVHFSVPENSPSVLQQSIIRQTVQNTILTLRRHDYKYGIMHTACNKLLRYVFSASDFELLQHKTVERLMF